MSELRIYRFPEWQETPYKHIKLKRDTEVYYIDKAPPTEHEGRLSESLSRSRRLIQEYILCNPFTLFVTLTFDEKRVTDRKDYKSIKSRLCKSFNNFKTRYDPTFRYLIVPELHQDGAVHFHGVMTTPVGLCTPLKIPYTIKTGKNKGMVKMVPNTKGYMNWPYYSERFGYFSCSWIRNYTGCAIYVSKYMTKELAEWSQKNDQIVMHSKGLLRPELVEIIPDGEIPGGIDKERGDYNGEYCAVAMRTAIETQALYFSGDDYWEHYQDEVERLAERDIKPSRPATPVTLPWATYFPAEQKQFPGPFDNWEQVSMNAAKIESVLSKNGVKQCGR